MQGSPGDALRIILVNKERALQEKERLHNPDPVIRQTIRICHLLSLHPLSRLHSLRPILSEYSKSNKSHTYTPPDAEQGCFRTVRCSSLLSLAQFQDRVIQPCMGFTRNYHAYMFIDPKNGSQFGPDGSNFLDMMHLENLGKCLVPDENVLLAQLLSKPDDELLYLYDFGDCFWHKITLVEVIKGDQVTGGIELLNGALMCPPDDSFGLTSTGSLGYEKTVIEFLNTFDMFKGQKTQITKKQSEEFNKELGRIYTGFQEAMVAINYFEERAFVPTKFNIVRQRTQLTKALKSSASFVKGSIRFPAMSTSNPNTNQSKITTVDYYENFGSPRSILNDPNFVVYYHRKSLRHLDETPIYEEIVRVNADPSKLRVCRVCGSPHEVVLCAGCKCVSYCGRACQKLDWRSHKEDCKNFTPLHLKIFKRPKHRYKIDENVEVKLGESDFKDWISGKVICLDWEINNTTRNGEKNIAAYQVEITNPKHPGFGSRVYAPFDNNRVIRLGPGV